MAAADEMYELFESFCSFGDRGSGKFADIRAKCSATAIVSRGDQAAELL